MPEVHKLDDVPRRDVAQVQEHVSVPSSLVCVELGQEPVFDQNEGEGRVFAEQPKNRKKNFQ